jgi:hypothetical protein
MASKIFTEHKKEIREYCAENNLSFDELCASPWCYDNEELIIQRNERDPERAKLGLADNIPTPSTLEIYLEDGKLRFEQTDITRKYLGVEEERDVAPVPRVAVAV